MGVGVKPFYDINNPGSKTDRIKSELSAMGVKRFHATCAHGADPSKVERELLMAFDRIKHGAVRRVTTRHDRLIDRLVWPVVDQFRIFVYVAFKQRKFINSLQGEGHDQG